MYDYNTLREKINHIISERETSTRETAGMNSLKDGVMRDQLYRI
jgi:macrodomain Ter protein organizer (MatP/YcbG family)